MTKFTGKNFFDDGAPISNGISVAQAYTPKLPEYVQPISRVPAAKLPAPQDVSVSVAGEGAIIPEVYGRVVIDRPRIFAVGHSDNIVALGLLWCRGEVSKIEKLYFGDLSKSSQTQSMIHKHYLGTATQAPDLVLQGTISGYNDSMAGLCYTRLTLAAGDITAAGSIRVIVQGKKLYDPRTTLTAYSTNFALMFRDLAVSRGLTIDDVNIGAAADYCDELLPPITGEKRRWGGFVFDKPDTVDNQLNLIAEHAGCFYVREGGTVKLVPDAPGSSVASFDDSTLDNMVEGSLKLTKRGLFSSPNQSIVEYRDQGAWPWRTGYARTADPDGDVRATTYRMYGFQSYAVAYRHAVERQNRFNLSDLSISFETFDEGIQVEVGDIITVSHSVGLSNKLMRVTDIRSSSFTGSWVIDCEEYDPAIYSDVVETEPTWDDIDVPSPIPVPRPGSPTITFIETVDQSGVAVLSANIDWPPLTLYPFLHSFEVRLFNAEGPLEILITTGVTTDTEIVLGPLASGQEHRVDIVTIGPNNVKSEYRIKYFTAPYATSVPGDVKGFFARGLGNQLRASWDAVVSETLIAGYELRYGASGVTWANAATIDTVSALTLVTTALTAGTYDVLIKAKDIGGNESVNAARAVDITIDNNPDGYVIAEGTLDHASSTLMTLVNLGTQWVTDSGETWNDLYPNAMSTYTNALYTYQTVGAAEYISEELDSLLSEFIGRWTVQSCIEVLAGTPSVGEVVQVYASAAWNSLGDVKGTYLGSKLRYYVAETGVVFLVNIPTKAAIDKLPIVRYGFSTSSASAYDRISITPDLYGFEYVSITVSDNAGGFSGTYVLDTSAPLNYVDFYVWDNADNSQVNKDYTYMIRGA